MTTKIVQLTELNTEALALTQVDGLLPEGTVITKRTVTFPGTPQESYEAVSAAKARLIDAEFDKRAHPVASLNAVLRKLGQLANGESFTKTGVRVRPSRAQLHAELDEITQARADQDAVYA